MKSDIKIFANNTSKKSIIKSLEITNGVKIGFGFDYLGNRQYKENAFIPKNNWRKLYDEEQSILFTDDIEKDINSLIGLFHLPKNIIHEFDKIGFKEAFCKDDYDDIFNSQHKKIVDVLKTLGNFFFELIHSNYTLSEVVFHGISFEQQALETVAYSDTDNKYFGLHIDRNISSNLFLRAKNPNRISINIGKESRYLLFVPLSIDSIFKMVVEKEGSFESLKNNLTEQTLVYNFFKHYPDYPVLRLEHKPYDVYVAPTDNIIHDGSTIGKQLPDMIAVFTGYFNPFI